MQVTTARNAKTLSPSHVKQCILGEARFDFLRDLVKNIPDVSAAEEKELMSEESSPNSSRFPDVSAPPRRIVREDSNSSSSCDVIRVPQVPSSITQHTRDHLKRVLSGEIESKPTKVEPALKVEAGTSTSIPALVPIKMTPTSTQTDPILSPLKIDPAMDTAIDLSKKEQRPVRTANFYQETLVVSEDLPTHSVIKVNPTYSTPQPSTSYTNLSSVEPVRKVDIVPKPFERHNSLPRTPVTPVTPVINIDFSKNLANPEIKVLDTTAANIVGVPKNDVKTKHVTRQNSKSRIEVKREAKPVSQPIPVNIDSLNSGNLQIDEDYDT